MNKNKKLYIIDGAGPFFSGFCGEEINWSKIPFEKIEKKISEPYRYHVRTLARFEKFLIKAGEMGYNAVSMDDLAHIVSFDFYPDNLKDKISLFKSIMCDAIKLARKNGMKVFINTDIMFFNEHIEQRTGNKNYRIKELLREACEIAFIENEIDGIIFRIGESDGLDVKGDFRSRLVIKTPEQVREYLESLIGLFEKYDRLLIFRTWTVGIYKIGDLIWNRKTFLKAFESIRSVNFIISMKYGDTDFYDMVDLNPLFFATEHRKLLELQTRREREGFGNLPFFVGWQYEKYRDELKSTPAICGISVWCQTGGWTKKKDLTFIKNSSMWNELNTYAAIGIFRKNLDSQKILQKFFKNDKWIEFITLYHSTFLKILYIEGFSDKAIYFRRLRIPPLLWLFWDNVIINPLIIALFEFAGMERFKYPADEIKRLRSLGREIGHRETKFYCDTLKILSRCRLIMVEKKKLKKLKKQASKFKSRYPDSFNFHIELSMKNYRKYRPLYKLIFREKSEYRFIDRFFLNGFVSAIIRAAVERNRNKTIEFARNQAMGIKEIFK